MAVTALCLFMLCQVEIDKLKWVREKQLEELDLQKAQVQELQHLKDIVEGNLQESIKSLSHEREVRYLSGNQCCVSLFHLQRWQKRPTSNNFVVRARGWLGRDGVLSLSC